MNILYMRIFHALGGKINLNLHINFFINFNSNSSSILQNRIHQFSRGNGVYPSLFPESNPPPF